MCVSVIGFGGFSFGKGNKVRVSNFANALQNGSSDGPTSPSTDSTVTTGRYVAGKTALSSYDGACFYLPKSVSKGLFLTSSTTAHEVVSILLTKFKVITPPRKFALYERRTSNGGE